MRSIGSLLKFQICPQLTSWPIWWFTNNSKTVHLQIKLQPCKMDKSMDTFCIHFVNYLPSSIAFSTFGLVFRSNELRKLLNWLLNTMQMILTLLLIVFIWLLVMITIRYSVKDLTNVGNKAYLLTQRGLPFQWSVFTYKLLEYIKKINSHDGTKREAGKLERILMTSRKKYA